MVIKKKHYTFYLLIIFSIIIICIIYIILNKIYNIDKKFNNIESFDNKRFNNSNKPIIWNYWETPIGKKNQVI